KNVKVYGAYQELIENAKSDGIEAVIIALPLHLHAKAAVAAMKARLHVLTEKLMGHSVRECKEMARVAEETGFYLATGHQRHYNILYANAVNLIQKGVLGDLHYIRAQWHRANLPGRDSWKMPLPPGVKTEKEDPDADRLTRDLTSWTRKLESAKKESDKLEGDKKTQKIIECEQYQLMVDQIEKQIEDKTVDAAKHEYEDAQWKMADGKTVYRRPAIEELIRWRLWNRTGGGLMAELGSHQLDAASIFISSMFAGDKQYPMAVSASACRPIFPADRDVEDHIYCQFEFRAPDYRASTEDGRRKRISVAYASINGNGFGGYGETVLGTDGTLILAQETDAMLYQTAWTDKPVKIVSGGKDRPAKVELLKPEEKVDAESAAIGKLAVQPVGRGYTEEIEHWAWCVRNQAPENQPRCSPKVALADAVIALVTNITARGTDKYPAGFGRIGFRKEWFDPDDDALPEKDLLGQDVKPDPLRYA
ncbi:MAG: Gfo/Idh/MocA family protein, partial [Planctomycetota bacterium]